MSETPTYSSAVLVDNHHEWKVNKILNNKACYCKRYYLVKWKEFSIEKLMWESEKNLKNTQETLKNYLKKRQNYKKTNKSTYRKKDKYKQDLEVADMFDITTDRTIMENTITEKDITDKKV
ncbi:uncharacterized protein CIMG_13337 [Coccidioides immitis RS]|uniref:Chromo domain-containing protein n=1 Tax=Coccidioides immitis (strain RS) TaxID=246410 RepID=A0A0D8JXE0_COCIM|nr:uncharacterized protein CIMG_13337 [Coccidioides immitis RS]KJF60943.1 hypothetical protein CIMG_13337 [Coccidioides immitis RS]